MGVVKKKWVRSMSQSENPLPFSTEPTPFDRFWWGVHSNTILLALVLILLVCSLSIFLYRNYLPSRQKTSPGATEGIIWPVQLAETGSFYYFVWPNEDKPGDIYQWDLLSQPVNLTNTPDYSEWWPVPSPGGDRIAFFAVSSTGERSLRVMEINGAVTDATYNPGDSKLGSLYQIDLTKPPRWSTDGAWIAFLGRSTVKGDDTVALFATSVARSTVHRLNQVHNEIVDFWWLEENQLIYIQQDGKRSLAFYRIGVSAEPIVPVLLNTLEVEP
jgi:Tol biopolymer transport system component